MKRKIISKPRQIGSRFGLMVKKMLDEEKRKMNFKHYWHFDLPWHLVNLKDWFYMINTSNEYIFGGYHTHVRILGIRSHWVISYE